MTDANHPLPMWPLAHVNAEPEETSAPAGKAIARRSEQNDAVDQLADVLRSAKRAYRAYLNELRQGDVEPAEDWSTWYAEYLLGR
jgi:hypothetical protein